MTGWRIFFAIGLLVFMVVPLAAPFREVLEPATWRWTEDDANRIAQLCWNTLTLCAGTAAIAIPAGLLLAVLLFRTTFLARAFCFCLLALLLFVPLPVIVSSWQATLGANGWLPLEFWRSSIDRPWATGMSAAVWVHALAATPWTTLITGLGLTWVEPELEDEAASMVGPWRVLLLVTLPRARASILAAGLFVVLQTASEISVTDMMSVQTLAEEVYTQFAEGRHGLGRSVALWMPILLTTWIAVFGMTAFIEASLPPLAPPTRAQRDLTLGPSWARFIAVILILAFVIAPLGSLLWKLGLSGYPGRWTAWTALGFLQSEVRLLGKDLLASLVTSFLTGAIVTILALAACFLARESRWFRWLLFGVTTWAWVIPAPVVGIGLLEVIRSLPVGPWKDALYYGPSPLPVMWVQTIRVLPIAVIFLWPVVRMIPREAFEEARVHGAGPLGQWFGIVVPMTWRAGAIATLLASALCLGEVAASIYVKTPGWEPFTKLLFDRMHFGVDNNVSALCVLMLGSLIVLGGTGIVLAKLSRTRRWTFHVIDR